MMKRKTAEWLRIIRIAFLALLTVLAITLPARAEEPDGTDTGAPETATWAVTFDDNGGMHDVGPEAGEVKVYSAANYPGVSIRAVAQSGNEFTDDDGDGVLLLPDGQYEFYIDCRHNHVIGDVTVSGAPETVSVGMWSFDDWLDAENIRMARGSGVASFDRDETPVERGDHLFRIDEPDFMSGSISVMVNFNKAAFTDEELAAKDPWVLRQSYSAVTHEYTFVGRVYNPNDRTVRNHCFQSVGKGSKDSYGIFENGDRIEADSPKGVSGPLWVFFNGDLPGYFRYQDYTIQVDRIPTLSALQVTDENGGAISSVDEFSAVYYDMDYDYEYRVVNTVRQVVVKPTPLCGDYRVTVNGQPLENGRATVDMDLDEHGEPLPTTATLTVYGGEYARDYTLTFIPMEGKRLTFNTTQPGTTVQVFNKSGEELLPAQSREVNGLWSYLYKLPDGETYTYIATKDEYYHSTKTFTMEESANKTIEVSVIDEENWLQDLDFPTIVWGSTGLPAHWLLEPVEFSPEIHYYDLLKFDSDGALRYTPTFDDTTYILSTRNWDVEQNTLRVYTDLLSEQWYNAFHLLVCGPESNQLTLLLSKEESGVTYYQDYVLNVKRFCTLSDFAVSCGGTALALEKPYEKGDLALTTKAPFDATSMTVYAPGCSGTVNSRYQYYYSIKVNGVETDENDIAVVPLSGTTETETVTIEVGCPGYEDAARTITLTVLKTQPVTTTVDVAPAEAVLTFRNNETAERIWPDAEGNWTLYDGYTFTYTLTAPGYVGRRGTVLVKTDDRGTYMILDGDTTNPIAAADDGERLTAALSLSISAAPENTTLDRTIEAEWADFRGTSYTWDAESGKLVVGGTANTNNCVVSAPTPIDAGDSGLYWASGIGKGMSGNAVSSPILVDGDLVVYAGDRLFRVDAVTGAVKAQGQMTASSAFSITPPFYYDGMLFVALGHGKIQAFDAKTLESLWVYTDPVGDQPNSPITIYDGYLYTGYWNKEDEVSSFICLTVTDEDPTRPDEPKVPTWTHLQLGGFYWAGAYVCDDYLLVGTDDGVQGIRHPRVGASGQDFNMSSELLMLDRRTGALLDKASELQSDIRCNIVYDVQTDAYYFTSKGGMFYQAKTAKDETGAWKISELHSLGLVNMDYYTNYGVPMSTSTPVVYNGRAYVGCCGGGQFNEYSGHNLTVIDIESWTVAYSVRTQGYPQTSGLLTTAYEDTGCVYVYFFDNYNPGPLRMLRDRPGQTAPDPVTTELYSKYGVDYTYDTAYVLFTPVGDQAQFAICSPICDQYGVMYFKNDSGYLMAFGPSIEKLEVTKPPLRTEYAVGETFDPAGMQVMLTYSNGMTRDVSGHVLYSEAPLEAGETEVTLSYRTLYHNADNEDGTSEPAQRGGSTIAGVAITVTAEDAPETAGRYMKYPDRAEIARQEAVWLLTDTGVLDAAEGAPFAPKTPMTGAQAAALLAKLGGASAFSGETVSYAALERALLETLGYDAEKAELADAEKLQALAAGLGLDAGLGEYDPAAAITREDAAQMAFNALLCDVVEYDGDTATSAENAGYDFRLASDGVRGGDAAMQLVERALPRVKLYEKAADGGVYRRWYAGGSSADYRYDEGRCLARAYAGTAQAAVLELVHAAEPGECEESVETCRAALYCAPGVSARLYAAFYDADGRLLAVEPAELDEAGVSLREWPRGEAAGARVFLLDENAAPLGARGETTWAE
ncbi:MAG: PQQ-binding-like beta-propeller repeat protein [Clostridia bacterium]|nr:PQQ-binding-like beta-propeller repeat protein [Clostridia bacterium]